MDQLADRVVSVFNAAMKMPSPDTSVKPSRPRRGRWLVVLAAFAALVWSLPRPRLQDVVVESDGKAPRGRLAFRSAERLAELSGKGTLAEETELSGPCFADNGQTLYFSRSRPGQRADIVRSTFTGERWSKPELVRGLNSVDDDRRLTLSGDGNSAALASNRSGGRGGFDIYEVTQANGRWSKPRNAGPAINTDADEFDPALAPDGLTMYFVRVVPGSSADIFVTRREELDSAWLTPRPVDSLNSPDHHERSPSVSPDGNWLLFASNRGVRSGESAAFGLFRAPLRDGLAGMAERLQDGIASDADDVDAAFAPDGQSLVFASKREGAKHIFLSRGDFVVTRLAVSTEHLNPLGPITWLPPLLATLLLIVAWRWPRRALPVAAIEAAKSTTTPRITAPKRSEPPKNPLQSWTVAPLEQAPLPMPAVNPLTVKKAAEPTTASQPVSTPTKVPPSRRRRWTAVAVVLAASVTFVVLRMNRSDQTASTPSAVFIELWSELARFDDIAPPQGGDVPKLERTNTAQSEAPQAIAPPSHVVALRPGARWPTDRVIVRQRSDLDRVDDVDQRLLSRTKAIVVARSPIPINLTRPLERPGEESTLLVMDVAAERPHDRAVITSTKPVFDPPSAERTAIPPAVANQAVLRAPATRRDQLVPATPSTITNSRQDSLARSGAAVRPVSPIGLMEPEALIAGKTATATIEAPLTAQAVSLSRTESVATGRPTQLDSTLPLERRTLPISAQNRIPVVAVEVARPTDDVDRSKLPVKESTVPKTVPLTEEVALPTPNTSSAETNALAPSVALSRHETIGPQPALSTMSNGLKSTRAELAALQTTSPLEPIEIANLTSKTMPIAFARRETLVPATVSLAAAEIPGGMGTAPAVLLTSATMLVELLTSAPLPELPRVESGSPATSVAEQSPTQLVRWLFRAGMMTAPNGLPAATEPNSAVAPPSLPRQIRETIPAELIETIPTTP